MAELMMYAFQPKGHGERSFFVMAESEASAREIIRAEIARRAAIEWEDDAYADEFLDPGQFAGWGTDYYRVKVFAPGQVATNAND